ncbi:MAG: hypothetical protein ACE14L_11710 [Terriglobales bacterium]
MPFEYTDEALGTLYKYLSPERLAAYYRLARGDQWLTLKLYEKGQPLAPGRVISELTFGFWVKLTGRVYEEPLWLPYLSRIFPIRLNRPVVHERLVLLKTLRNRIAHHERIIGRARLLPTEYEETIETIRWLSPTMADWVEQRNCFKERYATKIPKKRPQPPEPPMAAAAPIPITD